MQKDELFTNEFEARLKLSKDSAVVEEFSGTLVAFCAELANIVHSTTDFNSYLYSSCSCLFSIASLQKENNFTSASADQAAAGRIVSDQLVDTSTIPSVKSTPTLSPPQAPNTGGAPSIQVDPAGASEEDTTTTETIVEHYQPKSPSQSAVTETFSKLALSVGDDDFTVSQRNSSMTKASLATLVSQRTEANSKLNEDLNSLIEAISDYSNQITHYEQTYSKKFEKNLQDYESMLSKFMGSHIRRRNGVAVTLLDARIGLFRSMSELDSFQSGVIDRIPVVFAKLTKTLSYILAGRSVEDVQLGVELPGPVELGPISEALDVYKRNIGLLSIGTEHISANASLGIKSGYLWKRSKGPRKTWSRRYFLISNNQLLTRRAGKDSIVVDDLRASEWNMVDIDDRWGVIECHVSGSVFYLQAEGDIDFQEWTIAQLAVKTSVPRPGPSDNVPSLRPMAKSDSVIQQSDKAAGSLIPISEGRKQSVDTLSSNNNLLEVDNRQHTGGVVIDTLRNIDGELSRSETNLINIEPHSADQEGHFNPPPADVIIAGVLSVKDMKPSRRLSTGHRDYANVIWRTSTFTLKDRKIYTLQTNALTQEKELVDLQRNVLNRHYVQSVDESVFNRRHVFSIQTTGAGVLYYFAASSAHERQKWLYHIKEACHGRHLGADELPYRVYRSLSMRVVEGRNLTSGDVYCEIYIANERKARTPVRKSSDHFWRQDYQFNDMHSLRYGLNVIAMHQSRVRDVEIGRLQITQAMMKAGETEAWFPLTNDGGLSSFMSFSSTSNPGDLKIRFKYEEEIVLTVDQYQPLLETLDIYNPAVYELANQATDLEAISTLILCIHDAQGQSIEWLKFLIDNEVQKTDDPNVLFRGNSILTKGMDAYMKLVGGEYLERVLGNVLREIVDEKVSCEVDPTRIDSKKETLKNNWFKLMGYTIAVWNSIEESKTSIPRELRILFSYIQRQVIFKFGSDKTKNQMVRFTSVSGFLFLRLFCPCILNPRLFNITRDFADPKTSRTLTLLAKTMQCLANLASFGVKEPYMIEMNSFIMDHVNGLMEFIDHICTATSNTTPVGPAMAHDLELYLSQLNRFIRQGMKPREEDSAPQGKTEGENGLAAPPRVSSRSFEIASNQIEELIASKIA